MGVTALILFGERASYSKSNVGLNSYLRPWSKRPKLNRNPNEMTPGWNEGGGGASGYGSCAVGAQPHSDFPGSSILVPIQTKPFLGATVISGAPTRSKSSVELIEFRLEAKDGGQVAARTRLWEMEGFSWRWNLPSVGIYDIEVKPELRGQGLGKYLVAQILRYLQEQFFGLVEVHVPQTHEAATKLFLGLGFEQVDRGQSFRKTGGAP